MIATIGERLRRDVTSRLVQRLGRTGMFGSALWLLSAWLAVGGVSDWDAHRAGTPRDALKASISPNAVAQSAYSQVGLGQQPSSNLPALPSEQVARDALRQAVAVASQQGLIAGEISQSARLTPVAQEIELQFQLAGSYPILRRYLTDVLNAHPTALLRELSLRRESADPARVLARVRLVFPAQAMP